MTDPALDGPDAERTIAAVLADTIDPKCAHAAPDPNNVLNEQGVVLCDEHALSELLQQAEAGRALADDLLIFAPKFDVERLYDLLNAHGFSGAQ